MALYEATPVITTGMLQPVADTVLAALPVIAGVGLPIMGIVLAFRFVPKIIKMFAK